MSTQRPLGSASIFRLSFAKEEPKYGVGRRTSEWVTNHGGRHYRLAKGYTSKKWYLYVRNPNFRAEDRLEWSLVQPMKWFPDFGSRLADAKHNVNIFLCLGQGPDHVDWRE